MVTKSIELKQGKNQDEFLDEYTPWLVGIWAYFKLDGRLKEQEIEIEELRQQVAKLQGVIEESNKVMDEAEAPEVEGDLPKRIAEFAKSKEGSIPRERMLQIIRRMQQKARERHKND